MKKRVVLVTGASRGIGAAISVLFGKAGDTIIVNYLSNEDRARKVVEEITASGGTAAALQADVSKSDQAAKMFDEVTRKYGALDVLVNNAGMSKGGLLMLLDEKDWDAVIDSNLKGVFNCCKAASRQMISQRSGVIINMSSMGGITGLAGQSDYCASKGGIIAFTRALAKELAQFGIRVNSVSPGMIETEMTEDIPKTVRDKFLDIIPLKRFGTPDEVACVVRFLASSEAEYITGENIIVSGGLP